MKDDKDVLGYCWSLNRNFEMRWNLRKSPRLEVQRKLYVPGADRDQHQVFQTRPPHCLHYLFYTAWIGLSGGQMIG